MKRGLLLLFGLMLCASTVGCCCANPRPFWHRPFWGKWWGCGSCSCGNYCGEEIDDCGYGNCGCGSCGNGNMGPSYNMGASCNAEGCGYGLCGNGGCAANCVGCSQNKYYGDWWAGRARIWDPCDWCGNYTGPMRPPMRRAMNYAMAGSPTESYEPYSDEADAYGDYEVIDEGPAMRPTPAPKKSAPAPVPKTSSKSGTTARRTAHNPPVRRASPSNVAARASYEQYQRGH